MSYKNGDKICLGSEPPLIITDIVSINVEIKSSDGNIRFGSIPTKPTSIYPYDTSYITITTRVIAHPEK
jgi:hypothetical protein